MLLLFNKFVVVSNNLATRVSCWQDSIFKAEKCNVKAGSLETIICVANFCSSFDSHHYNSVNVL